MSYELHRTPRLLRTLGVKAPAAARAFNAGHLSAMRTGLKWSKATFTLHFAALKQLLRWAHNPLVEQRGAWRLPSGEAGHRRWLSKAQLLMLVRAARGRERTLVALEGLNGLRRVEVLRLTAGDVDFEEGSLVVHGKGRYGGKLRRIPMHRLCRQILFEQCRDQPSQSRLLALSPSGADALLSRAAVRAGFPKIGVRVSHHDLRRTFGRLCHEAGMDLVQLKNLFGHSSIDMTVHYIGLDAERMREGLARLDSSLRAGGRRPEAPARTGTR